MSMFDNWDGFDMSPPMKPWPSLVTMFIAFVVNFTFWAGLIAVALWAFGKFVGPFL